MRTFHIYIYIYIYILYFFGFSGSDDILKKEYIESTVYVHIGA